MRAVARALRGLAIAAALLAAQGLRAEPDIDNADRAVVRVVVEDGEGKVVGFGSGFYVTADGYVVTAAHLVTAQRDAEGSVFKVIETGGDKEIDAEVVSYHRERDLAVLKADTKEAHYLDVADVRPRQGETVYAIGYPFVSDLQQMLAKGRAAANPTLSSGRIMRPVQREALPGIADSDANVIQHQALVTEGNSGGPLLNDCGDVVGVNVMALQNYAYYSVSSVDLTAELERDLAGSDFKPVSGRCWMGIGSNDPRAIASIVIFLVVAAIAGTWLLRRRMRRAVAGAPPSAPPRRWREEPTGAPSIAARKGRELVLAGFDDDGRHLRLVIPEADARKGVVIGRSDVSNIVIPDDRISRKHLRIGFDGSSFLVTDLGSSNLTYLNGRRLNPQEARPIASNDKIKLANTEFRVSAT